MSRVYDTFQPKSRKAWRQWLKKHHASSPGIWLVYAKKHTGIPSLSYNDVLDAGTSRARRPLAEIAGFDIWTSAPDTFPANMYSVSAE